jgi:antitoxin component YwqK of YwqJK toxin-antitoxin module
MTIVIALIVLFLVIPYLFRLYDQREEPGFKKEFYDNGSLKSKTPCKNGKLEGLGTWWHETGIKWRQRHYKNGLLEGVETYWYEDGVKSVEQHYKNGEKDGLSTYWENNGTKKFEEHWKDGKQEGLETQYHLWEPSFKTYECNYKNGQKNGLETYWYTISDRYYPTDGRKCKQGNKKSTQYYKDGLLHGKKTTWDEDGKKTSEVNFVDGEEEK